MLAVVPLQSAHVTPARPFTADARVRGGALAAAAAAAAACSGALVISDALGRGSLRSAMVPAPRVSRCCALSWQCRAPETRARASYLLPLGFRTIQQLFWPVSARAAIYWATSWCLMQRTSDNWAHMPAAVTAKMYLSMIRHTAHRHGLPLQVMNRRTKISSTRGSVVHNAPRKTLNAKDRASSSVFAEFFFSSFP